MTVADLTYWHWWIFAIALLLLELFAPGAFFLWLSIAAGIVGLLLMVAPETSWQIQMIVFAVLSVISIFVWRKYFRGHLSDTDQPTLNRRGEQYIGRVFTLDEAIVDGKGKIRVDDSTWIVNGDDCAAGTKVVVNGVNSTILHVAAKVD
ncbi:MAG: NfeD family protein [Gammaproteobacteria bacterium]